MNSDSLKVRRILVIRLGQIGDIVLTAPLVRALKNRFPLSEISMLTKARFTKLSSAIPGLHKTLSCPRSFFSLLDIRHKLRASDFDIVVDLQNNLKSRRYSYVVSPKRLFRFHRWRKPRWFFINFPSMRSKISKPKQIPTQYLQVASALGIDDDGLGLELEVKAEWREAANVLLEEFRTKHDLNAEDKVLIIAPGASRPTKIWSSEKWVEFLKLAYENGYRHQVIVGAGRTDRRISKIIASMIQHPLMVTTDKTSIEVSIGLISLANKMVTNDSGPMHLAAGVGTPLVGIYGPTVEEFGFSPFRCISEIAQVEGLDCRPCHPHGPKKCPRGHFKCMDDITPEHLMSKLEKLDESLIEKSKLLGTAK